MDIDMNTKSKIFIDWLMTTFSSSKKKDQAETVTGSFKRRVNMIFILKYTMDNANVNTKSKHLKLPHQKQYVCNIICNKIRMSVLNSPV